MVFKPTPPGKPKQLGVSNLQKDEPPFGIEVIKVIPTAAASMRQAKLPNLTLRVAELRRNASVTCQTAKSSAVQSQKLRSFCFCRLPLKGSPLWEVPERKMAGKPCPILPDTESLEINSKPAAANTCGPRVAKIGLESSCNVSLGVSQRGFENGWCFFFQLAP